MPYSVPATASNPQPVPINRYSARSSYFGASGYSPSEGLKRARKPFRTRNFLTGAAILGFAGSVYFYSISAVKQDDFSDLPVAGKEGVRTIEEEMADQVKGGAQRGVGAMMGMGSSPQGEGVRIPQKGRAVDPVAQEQHPFLSPQPAELAAPLLPAIGARASDTSSLPSTNISSGVRPTSRFIVGAPDVDRPSKIWERNDEKSISGKRVV
ncbi:MAG: hypothetical protein CYPHOPRED_001983 [Cyphobasidiales sp. Tagirdzhanova-0007]|nr:MAG: hypothetical protein CYPHOPRED_001983 [Cyphobasidiales sp. Tagirdzhanova-0007]